MTIDGLSKRNIMEVNKIMKKKVIFMVINMNIGGTEKALLNMISEFPKDKYEITIFMLEKSGGFLNYIPNDIKVEFLHGYKDLKEILNQPPHIVTLNLIKRGQILKASNILFLYLVSKFMKERTVLFKHLLKGYRELREEYDVAIAYAGPMDFISYFVTNKIKAKRKIQWIHFDISKIGFNKYFASKYYNKFDKIFVVSNEGKIKLNSILPDIKVKTNVFHNIISSTVIYSQAKNGVGFTDNFDGFRLLTVGRLSFEKGQDIVIRILAKLIQDGYKVKWYCVGDGNARKDYELLIKKYNLKDQFILMGATPNPYPYMEQCDIYVQPSRHEGYCITLSEAKILNKPIVTTDFTGAREQIIHEQTGLIVNFDKEHIYAAIKRLLDDEKLRDILKRNLQKNSIKQSKRFENIIDDLNQKIQIGNDR